MVDHSVTASSPRKIDRRFYLSVSLVIAVCIVVGFGPTYFFRGLSEQPPLPLVVHVHGLAFSAWIALLLAQVVLIRTGSPAIHRRLGVIGIALAVAMLVLGTAVTLVRAPLATDLEDLFYALGFADLIMFAAFFLAAITLRAKSDYHKRLMLLATVAIIDAGVNRLPFMHLLGPISSSNMPHLFVMYFLTDIPVFAGLAYDYVTRRMLHPALVWGCAILIVSQFIRVAIIETAMWQSVTAFLLRLA
jgi:hypothetical protein